MSDGAKIHIAWAVGVLLFLWLMSQAHAGSFDTNRAMLTVPVPMTPIMRAMRDVEQRCLNARQFNYTLNKAWGGNRDTTDAIPECDEYRYLRDGQ